MKKEKNKKRISKQDTVELDKNWFNDLEPPKRYNSDSKKSSSNKKTSKSKNSAKSKKGSKSVKNTKAKPNSKQQNYYIEPPRTNNRQKSPDYSSRSKSNIDNMSVNERRIRENNKRRQKIKARRIIAWISVIFLTLAVGVVLSLTVFFPINSIEVKGNKVYDKNQIIDICSIKTKENLFLAKTDVASSNIKTNLPYIQKADIKRKLPGTIVITVTETAPEFAIKQNKSYILLDDELKVLDANSNSNMKAVLIKGTQIKSATTGHTVEFKNKNTKGCIDDILQSIKSTKLEKVTAIGCSSMTDNYIIYDNRITIKYGDTDNLDYKTYQALAAIDKLNSDNPSVKGEVNVTGDKAIYFTEK